MNYNTIYKDKRRSLIDVNRNDTKLMTNILIDILIVTLEYLEQRFKPTYWVTVNQSIEKIIKYTLILRRQKYGFHNKWSKKEETPLSKVQKTCNWSAFKRSQKEVPIYRMWLFGLQDYKIQKFVGTKLLCTFDLLCSRHAWGARARNWFAALVAELKVK